MNTFEKELIRVDAQIEFIESLFNKGAKDLYFDMKSPKVLYRDILNPELKALKEKKEWILNNPLKQ